MSVRRHTHKKPKEDDQKKTAKDSQVAIDNE